MSSAWTSSVSRSRRRLSFPALPPYGSTSHCRSTPDLPPLDGAKGKLGIADLKEGDYAAEEAFG